MDNKNDISVLNEVLLPEMDKLIINHLDRLNLPSADIFTDVKQRMMVFKNFEDVIRLIDTEKRISSYYISKFIAAVSAGLFDAALNYIWDETILQLRERVIQYDIQYFYDCAVKTDKRAKLKDESDIVKVDDSELLIGCKQIGLISSIGFKLLENIKFMRNWASAAHPNNHDISGLQLIAWLETCIKEAICLPLNYVTIETNRLLSNIKENELDENDIEQVSAFFIQLPEDKVDSLANGFFGIYTREETDEKTRENITNLLPKLWDRISEEVKNSFGIKYAQFSANAQMTSKKLCRSFLESCDGQKYIPDDLRVSEINDLLQTLRKVHTSMDNFYNEVLIAKPLSKIVGGKIPTQVMDEYVQTLVYVYLTNGYGVAESANPYYIQMIKAFDDKAAMKAIISIQHDQISGKLANRLSRTKYFELVDIMESKITSPMFKTLIEIIRKSSDLSRISSDVKFAKQIELIRKNMK